MLAGGLQNARRVHVVLMSTKKKMKVRGRCGHEFTKASDEYIATCPKCGVKTAYWRPQEVAKIAKRMRG